jgi:hypothetical protein
MKAFRSPLLIGLCFSCLAGCGQKAHVYGTVALDGRPLVWGSVNLMDAGGHAFQGQIQPDGKYEIDGVPYGKFSVMISNPDPRPPLWKRQVSAEAIQARKDKKPRELTKELKEFHSKWFAIPDKYQDYNQSGLSLDVNRSSVIFDIPLTQ